MKLKKKIAVLLTSVLIATAMNTSVFAQTAQDIRDYTLQKTGYKFTYETAPQIKISLKDEIKYTGKDIVFYVELENAKWLNEIQKISSETNFKKVTLTVLNKEELEVRLRTSQEKGDYYIPLITELTGGEAKVKIDGNGTQVSNMGFTTFAGTTNKKIEVTAGDPLTISQEGKVADIVIEEIIKGSLAEGLGEKDRIITLSLDNSDLEFSSDKVKVEATKGFKNVKGITTRYLKSSGGAEDKGAIQIVLPKISNQSDAGKLKISNIYVKGIKPAKGSILINVDSYAIGRESVKVGQVKDYGVTLEMKDSKKVELIPGKNAKISFSISEAVPSSLVEGRAVSMKLTKGYFSPYKEEASSNLSIGKILLNGKNIKNQLDVNIIRDDEFVVGFTFKVPKLEAGKVNTLTFEDVAIFIPLTEEGEVMLTAEGRDIDKTLSVVAGVVRPSIEAMVNPAYLKYGVKNQKGGKVTISETDKGMIREGVITLQLEERDGIWFEEKPSVTVTKGDIKLGKVKFSSKFPRIIEIEIDKASKKASVIEITDFYITVDATVADGSYDLTISGDALGIESDLESKIDKEFIFVGQQVNSPSLSSAAGKVARFTIGSTTYFVNGQAKIMDAQPYVLDNRTMVPIKYVSEIAGIDPKNITFDQGVVTIIGKNKIVQLEQGSNIAKVNGAQIVIDGKVSLANGRVYVPVSQVASLLDIKVTWDAATKTAVFES